jgi:hypothetical protein
MREFHFDPQRRTPLVRALLVGPKATKQVRLVFDTGAAMTQFHEATMRFVGLPESAKIADAFITGPTDNEEKGYVASAARFFVLGKRFEDVHIAGYNLSRLAKSGIDGLLGFDLISQLHLEMDGPSGLLKIF